MSGRLSTDKLSRVLSTLRPGEPRPLTPGIGPGRFPPTEPVPHPSALLATHARGGLLGHRVGTGPPSFRTSPRHPTKPAQRTPGAAAHSIRAQWPCRAPVSTPRVIYTLLSDPAWLDAPAVDVMGATARLAAS